MRIESAFWNRASCVLRIERTKVGASFARTCTSANAMRRSSVTAHIPYGTCSGLLTIGPLPSPLPNPKPSMPGPHLTLTRRVSDGGCDGWLSSWWEVVPNGTNHYRQWWTGWHSPKALSKWCWPGKKSHWTLIGHERWDLRSARLGDEQKVDRGNPNRRCPLPKRRWLYG